MKFHGAFCNCERCIYKSCQYCGRVTDFVDIAEKPTCATHFRTIFIKNKNEMIEIEYLEKGSKN